MNVVKVVPRPFRFLGVPALAMACALLAGCDKGRAVPTPAEAPEVSLVQARPAAGEYPLLLPARAQAGQTAQVYARATGLVGERRVDLGDRVRAGQVLATIAAPEIDQAVREARAQVAQAEAGLALARGNHERAAAMLRTQLISREDYSSRLGARDAAQAALDAARAQLASARERQGFSAVRAPFDGVVSARNIERGDRVVGDAAASMVPMFRVDALDPLRIAVDVPQSAALQVRPGLRAQVTFPELPGEQFDAEVVRTAQRISEEAGGMRVELRLPNPDNRIPAGMVGQVRLSVPRAAPAAVLPLAALVQDGATAKVAQVGEDGQLRYVEVVLGRNLGNEIEVLSGVAAGDAVVLAPNALLADGVRVRVKPPAQ
ncbi:efflux RND transporter periplasmic adaptor subunit [Flavobacterium sp. MXW15]|uniref:Efflux RND transporter periplasmic adaptor subunit n=1 Tax=Xanthomonas chitinilytica TaxID=2989819 RepID=A0ABT3JZP3_9XANT|nr:efflux RND transporter periplasmic adaptor subunit [Xanthomonas sp. H13-6]MCW4456177.1 efflux RND transporter periplasmic adaptor subunit [Flavobacterium sp. MXW15]MCW4473938.1 efflux RND transporter periplasmic adaptor subunit [Xanthomonas sp. H13-6]